MKEDLRLKAVLFFITVLLWPLYTLWEKCSILISKTVFLLSVPNKPIDFGVKLVQSRLDLK